MSSENLNDLFGKDNNSSSEDEAEYSFLPIEHPESNGNKLSIDLNKKTKENEICTKDTLKITAQDLSQVLEDPEEPGEADKPETTKPQVDDVNGSEEEEEEERDDVEDVQVIIYTCNECNHVFVNGDTRYTCEICEEYDLCSICNKAFAMNSMISPVHKKTHDMTEIIHGDGEEEEPEEGETQDDNSDYTVGRAKHRALKNRKKRISKFLDVVCKDEEDEDETDEQSYEEESEDEEEHGNNDEIPDDLKDFIVEDEEEELKETAAREFHESRKRRRKQKDRKQQKREKARAKSKAKKKERAKKRREKHNKRRKLNSNDSDHSDLSEDSNSSNESTSSNSSSSSSSASELSDEVEDLKAYTNSILDDHRKCKQSLKRLRRANERDQLEADEEEREEERSDSESENGINHENQSQVAVPLGIERFFEKVSKKIGPD
ncbi:MAG: hypothetical protein Sylvanvirus4_33 [Sylvanvirus sp.]|uniref:ZZ-type domain-containing protein n=1 Tax=Sylvanvirus sp. TaxID=2487774 RepID=A0A3G5AKZ0_9VIRU|nr:MAG: hypothetical protein Sylvanvirus4_33 [Sylvanvirus sp.]